MTRHQQPLNIKYKVLWHISTVTHGQLWWRASRSDHCYVAGRQASLVTRQQYGHEKLYTGSAQSYIHKANRTTVSQLLGWAPESRRRQFRMESALRVTVAVGWGQFRNPGRGTSAVGTRYQRTGVGQQTEGTRCMCSELQADCVWNGNNAKTKETKLNSMALVCERTILTKRPPLVGEVNANFCR
jgi:hypothetical protein